MRLNRKAISLSNDIPKTMLSTSISYDNNVINELNSSTVNVSVTEENDLTTLNELRSRYPDKIIISHLNINSIRNKFDMLANIVMGKLI